MPVMTMPVATDYRPICVELKHILSGLLIGVYKFNVHLSCHLVQHTDRLMIAMINPVWLTELKALTDQLSN